MIGANSGRQREFELLRFRNPLCRHVSRPERLRDDNIRIEQMTIEPGILAVLVARDHEFVTVRFKVRTKPEFTGDAADELPRLEPQRSARRRERLTVRIGLEDGNIVAGVFRRIAGGGIGIKNAKNRATRS